MCLQVTPLERTRKLAGRQAGKQTKFRFWGMKKKYTVVSLKVFPMRNDVRYGTFYHNKNTFIDS